MGIDEPSKAAISHWPLDSLTMNKEVSSHRKTRITPDIPLVLTHSHRNRLKEKESTFFVLPLEPGASYIS